MFVHTFYINLTNNVHTYTTLFIPSADDDLSAFPAAYPGECFEIC